MLLHPNLESSSYSISGIGPSNETSDSKCNCEIPRFIENYIDFAEDVIDPSARIHGRLFSELLTHQKQTWGWESSLQKFKP